MGRLETQKSIAAWADQTFGRADLLTIANRASQEASELVEAVYDRRTAGEILEEAADVGIILRRLCHELGCDLDSAIDRKMAKNRLREWERIGNGDGRHK